MPKRGYKQRDIAKNLGRKKYQQEYYLKVTKPRRHKKHLSLILLILILVPIANAFTIDDPTFNFVTPRGGILRYATVAQLTSWDLVTYIITNLIYTGHIAPEVIFDCETGVNMTILDVQIDSLTYNVSAVGEKHQYIYFNGYAEPASTVGLDSYIYNSGNKTLTITSTGDTEIIIQWDAVGMGSGGGVGLLMIIALIFLALIYYSSNRR